MDRLRAEGITKSFGGTTVIQDVSLTLHEDELVCLLGVSGVGKSTLFNVLSGLLAPDSGRVLLGGEEITGQTGRISYMQQKDLLLPHKRIEDNIALPLVLKGMPRRQARAQVRQGLAEFGLEGTERKYPGQLSGGMRQRAALYRTYLFNSEVALLDEPFSALDAITKSQLHLWYLEMMSRLHMSAIFITHDIDEAIFLSDRIYIMSGSPGTISQEIEVRQPRPRTTRFTASETFMEYKRQILDALKIQ
ncbi:MAG TPA: ABC transporter ATP-binding protein [Candidatus Fimivicinus intestinavium]|mgnify:CR=1 FL=1|nr:ABC transporter ATP-binding protein [Candidatus Fimivicinus intestinavium]